MKMKLKKKSKYQPPKIIDNKKIRTNLLSRKGYDLDNLIAAKHLLTE